MLRDYSIFVDAVRRKEKIYPFSRAVEEAIDECIEQGIPVDFLLANRAEVLSVSIFEYGEEKHMR